MGADDYKVPGSIDLISSLLGLSFSIASYLLGFGAIGLALGFSVTQIYRVAAYLRIMKGKAFFPMRDFLFFSFKSLILILASIGLSKTQPYDWLTFLFLFSVLSVSFIRNLKFYTRLLFG